MKAWIISHSDLSGDVHVRWEEIEEASEKGPGGTVVNEIILPPGFLPAAIRAVLVGRLPSIMDTVLGMVSEKLILELSPRNSSPDDATSYYGREVITAAHLEPRDFQDRRASARRPAMRGTIVAHSDSHGLCFRVRLSDGTESWYDPDEIVLIGSPVSEALRG